MSYYGRSSQEGDTEEPPTKFTVRTNVYKANLVGRDAKSAWHQYRVTIIPKRHTRNEDWKNDRPPKSRALEDARPEIVERFQTKHKNGSALTRNILQQLSKLYFLMGRLLVTDGVSAAFSPNRVTENDEEEHGIGVERDHFRVVVSYLSPLSLRPWFEIPSDPRESQNAKMITKCLQSIINYSMAFNCIVADKNPTTFFLNEQEAIDIIQEEDRKLFFQQCYGTSQSCAPFISLSQSVKFNDDGQYAVAMIDQLSWLYRGETYNEEENCQMIVPLLNEKNGILAGVHIPALDEKITNEKTRNQIEKNMKKLTFRVMYIKGDGWALNCHEKGKDQEYIDRYRHVLKSLQRMFNADYQRPGIKWSCEEEKFQIHENGAKVTYNVAEYFKKVYDIKIRYPNLPIIRTRNGWFPIEFLYQEWSRVSLDNGDEKAKDIQRYYDWYDCTKRLQHTHRIKDLVYNKTNTSLTKILSLTEILNRFGVQIEKDPLVVEASRVLPPTLSFKNSEIENPWKGSWKLGDTKFVKPATLYSYAVVDFGRGGMFSSAGCFMNSFFRYMEDHGMTIANDGVKRLDDVTAKGDGDMNPQKLYDLFDTAIHKARTCFVENYRKFNRLGFRTMANFGDDGNHEAIITQDLENRLGYFAIPCNTSMPTHVATNTKTGKPMQVRIQYFCNNKWEDPTNIINVQSINDVGFMVQRSGEILSFKGRRNPPSLFPVEPSHIECPSIVFFILRKKNSKAYDTIKAISDLEFGINTQCVVDETWKSWSKIEYLSKIALKVNTKLFSTSNQSCGWKLRDGFPWIDHLPTMVMGYSVKYGTMIDRSVAVIAGCVCLPSTHVDATMSTAQAVEIMGTEPHDNRLNEESLKSLVKKCVDSYYYHFKDFLEEQSSINIYSRRKTPIRLLVYRNGGTGESLGRIATEEVRAIRDSIWEINRSTDGYTCRRCGEDTLCGGCETRVTMIVAHEDHNIRMALTVKTKSGIRNAPSGTLVHNGITQYSKDDYTFDFFLISQHGSRGTSKPVHYCVVRNESAGDKGLPPGYEMFTEPLTRDTLYEITHRMTFQYGTVTNSVRKVPILLTSKKLAERVMKYDDYLPYSQNFSLQYDEKQNRIFRVEKDGRQDSGIFGGQKFASGVPQFHPNKTG